MRQFLIRCLIWLIEHDLKRESRTAISNEQRFGLLSQLWENPAFRQYVADRNQRLIYSMVGAPGAKTEPRDRFIQLQGQRLEILEFASLCKRMTEKRLKDKKLSTGENVL